MKLTYGILTEAHLRSICIRSNKVYENYDILEWIVDTCYGGEFTKLLFRLINNGCLGYENITNRTDMDFRVTRKVDGIMSFMSKLKTNRYEETLLVRHLRYNSNFDIYMSYADMDIIYPSVVMKFGEMDPIVIDSIVYNLLTAVNNWLYSHIPDEEECIVLYLMRSINKVELVLL